jgi:hypothetical protein
MQAHLLLDVLCYNVSNILNCVLIAQHIPIHTVVHLSIHGQSCPYYIFANRVAYVVCVTKGQFLHICMSEG